MTRILLTGVNGQLGFELQRVLAPLTEVIALNRQQMDLTNPKSIIAALNKYQPTIIVNPAAYTAVDKAETEVAQAMAINAHAPKVMAQWAEQHHALLVHYSTDYVFDGTKKEAYVEDDTPNPPSVYGQSKWLGEQAVVQHCTKYLILRTSWVFGVHGNNFLKTMLGLAKERDSLNVVADQYGAPTSAALIAHISTQILTRYCSSPSFDYGTYHLCASGATTWCDYARFVVQEAQKKPMTLKLSHHAIEAIPSSCYPTPATRPTNSRLNCNKLAQTFALSLPDWHQGVTDVVKQLMTDALHCN